jgi:hypothetical protein
VTRRIDAATNPVQATLGDTVRYRTGTEAQRHELRATDDTMLTLS